MIKRIYVEKKEGFDSVAESLYRDLKGCLDLPLLLGIRIINRYDVEGIDDGTFKAAKYTVFAEPATETAYEENLPEDVNEPFFAVEYLQGQFDERADSVVSAIKIINPSVDVDVRFAKIIAPLGNLSDVDVEKIKKYCINPVDSREAELLKPDALPQEGLRASYIEGILGFTRFTEKDSKVFRDENGFAMTNSDVKLVRRYFMEEENRDPTITELRAIDAYWSDHCRHSTFLTNLKDIKFNEGTDVIQEAFNEYKKMREEVYGDEEKEKPISLMDIACIGAKYIKKKGLLEDLEESDEVNACSIKIKADVDGREEDWLLLFKNETHNHPTEIEPFGGAGTCLGGAIRDPLSGRAIVYQAMRVTGSGDPRKTSKDTLPGKLPQRKITTEAALGYSSYGNQVGVATGLVNEVYDEGFVAKRMELGALVGAVPMENVVREKPVVGDVIILVGGRTGRDGCGGAAGSSKGHTKESILKSGAEVQKGKAAIERSILRLFRKKEVSTLIKKCNDFGAGGVAVAVGELAESIDVNLDNVLKKYESLDGTELAISESQERMAVVVADRDKAAFIKHAEKENLEATVIAEVTDTGRFRMFWRGLVILDLKRAFLNTNGAVQEADVTVKSFEYPLKTVKTDYIDTLKDLNCCSQKGLVDRFDSTIGAATVLTPLGGKYQLSPSVGMVAKLPVEEGETNTATMMAYGFNPEILRASPFHGAVHAVMESITKIVAMGGEMSKVRLSFQEYFEKMKNRESWGKPFAALLGALKVQKELLIPSIGGKDSMSGTFMDIDVPPTLVSFAVCISSADLVVSSEFKTESSKIVLVSVDFGRNGLPDFGEYRAAMDKITALIKQKKILASNTVGAGGILISLVKMAAGNRIGFKISNPGEEKLRAPDCTALVLEVNGDENVKELFSGIPYKEIGETKANGKMTIDGVFSIGLAEGLEKWSEPLEEVFPTKSKPIKANTGTLSYHDRENISPKFKAAKPRVLIPVFYGTNNEVDLKRAFEKAGAEVRLHILRDLDQKMLIESISELAEKIKGSQILMVPDGAIPVVFRDERIKDAISYLMENRDGLMLGTGGGFQTLLRLSLLPYGEIRKPDDNGMALINNTIGRHISTIVRTRVTSVKSPWLSGLEVGDIHSVVISHSEGRFIASEEQIESLSVNGQIAFQYIDFKEKASMEEAANPNGSANAIESITSPDGRILGKTGHPERISGNLYKNVPGNYDQKIFESGVKYYNY